MAINDDIRDQKVLQVANTFDAPLSSSSRRQHLHALRQHMHLVMLQHPRQRPYTRIDNDRHRHCSHNLRAAMNMRAAVASLLRRSLCRHCLPSLRHTSCRRFHHHHRPLSPSSHRLCHIDLQAMVSPKKWASTILKEDGLFEMFSVRFLSLLNE